MIRKAVNSELLSEEEHSSGVGSKLARLSTRTTNRVEASCCQASVLPHPPRSLPCPRLSSLCKRVVFIPVRPVNKEGKGQRKTVVPSIEASPRELREVEKSAAPLSVRNKRK